MNHVAASEHKAAAGRVRSLLAAYEKQRDLILLGAYKPGSDPTTDEAIAKMEDINAVLRQGLDENTQFDDTVARLKGV